MSIEFCIYVARSVSLFLSLGCSRNGMLLVACLRPSLSTPVATSFPLDRHRLLRSLSRKHKIAMHPTNNTRNPEMKKNNPTSADESDSTKHGEWSRSK